MKKLGEVLVSYLLKGGILLETKGVFETEITIPIMKEHIDLPPTKENILVKVKCNDLTIHTIKEKS